mmetsp:Transcript_43057/g.133861  ORF Transcript_43057/g.133861 Transcript_43057/m.133861 type:complete len:381 (-) Transcript_43057:17-1159(-)
MSALVWSLCGSGCNWHPAQLSCGLPVTCPSNPDVVVQVEGGKQSATSVQSLALALAAEEATCRGEAEGQPLQEDAVWPRLGEGAPEKTAGRRGARAREPEDDEEEAEPPGASAPPPLRGVSERQASALAALRAALTPKDLDAATAALVPGESLSSCLLRFLKASELRPAEAARALREDLSWRIRENPAGLADRNPQEVAGCDAELLMRYAPTWHQGFDRRGRPLLFAHYGKMRLSNLLRHTSVDKLLRLHIHRSEHAARLCGQQTAKLGRDITSVVTIVDAEGLAAQNLLAGASYTWAQGMARIDQDHYPDRLGQLLVINAPQMVYRFWKVVQYFLPEQTRERVSLYSGREKWLPKLLELVDPEELPPEYGGYGVHRGRE